MRTPPTWNISGNIRFYTDSGRTYSASLGGSQSLADGTSFMSTWGGTTSTNGTTGYAGFVDNAGVSAPFTGYIEANAEL